MFLPRLKDDILVLFWYSRYSTRQSITYIYIYNIQYTVYTYKKSYIIQFSTYRHIVNDWGRASKETILRCTHQRDSRMRFWSLQVILIDTVQVLLCLLHVLKLKKLRYRQIRFVPYL